MIINKIMGSVTDRYNDDPIVWFELGMAEKLLNPPKKNLAKVHDLLRNDVYSIFQENAQAKHIQFHHYCQPVTNETTFGKQHFDLKNKECLDPVITELETLYLGQRQGANPSYVNLHIADANLDELEVHSPDLLIRLQALTKSGFVKISGGVLDEAFLGPDSVELSAASVICYIEKVARLFGEDAIAPIVWIPERFFEQRTGEILNLVYDNCQILQKKAEYLSIIVDQDVLEISLPRNYKGNIFTGWKDKRYEHLRIFASSDHLRAVMPKATPNKVNDYVFSEMKNRLDGDTKRKINWFIQEYSNLINRYDQLNNRQNIQQNEVDQLVGDINKFIARAGEEMKGLEAFILAIADDLEKNGSWPGSAQNAFGKGHFRKYLAQGQNLFNPYRVVRIDDCKPVFQEIEKILPGTYPEFGGNWNKNPEDVIRWRDMTLMFINNGINTEREIEELTVDRLQALGMSEADRQWYIEYRHTMVSWRKGQFDKYPEIKLNYILAQIVFNEIMHDKPHSVQDYLRYLRASELTNADGAFNADDCLTGHLLRIWNKNRASCPNFIGLFGGTAIMYFRLGIALQLASVLTIQNKDNDYITRDVSFKDEDIDVRWTLLKIKDDIKILDEHGNVLFAFNDKNLHSLASGFVRHPEGFMPIIKGLMEGRKNTDIALVETGGLGATTSAHELVTALDQPALAPETKDGPSAADVIKKTYPEKLNVFDTQQPMLGEYPTAMEQIWILPPDAVDSPAHRYKEGDFGNFQWGKTVKRKYPDHITYSRNATYNGNSIKVTKRVSLLDNKTSISIVNMSDKEISMSPFVTSLISLDWYKGSCWRVNGKQLPQNGDWSSADPSDIEVIDEISNMWLKISSASADLRAWWTTAYSCLPSDKNQYEVSPQHELIMLGSREAVALKPKEEYKFEYAIENNTLKDDNTWIIDRNNMPANLNQRIDAFTETISGWEELTVYQQQRLIYARFHEEVFFVKEEYYG
ncbi:MAG: hypothetical protein ABIH39_07525 [Candidatus Margulisiibacteriota bacterium]